MVNHLKKKVYMIILLRQEVGGISEYLEKGKNSIFYICEEPEFRVLSK